MCRCPKRLEEGIRFCKTGVRITHEPLGVAVDCWVYILRIKLRPQESSVHSELFKVFGVPEEDT